MSTILGGPTFWDPALCERWLSAAERDAELALSRRGADLRLDLVNDGRSCGLVFDDEGVALVESHVVGTSVLRVAGDAAAWSRFLAPVPPRFHTDVMAMRRRGCGFEVSGEQSFLYRYPHVLHRMFNLARAVNGA